jgi:hypothetical protein
LLLDFSKILLINLINQVVGINNINGQISSARYFTIFITSLSLDVTINLMFIFSINKKLKTLMVYQAI